MTVNQKGLVPESSSSAIAADDALRGAQLLMQQKLGALILQIQRFERLLKAALVDAEVMHTVALNGDQHQLQRIKKFEAKSLGLLVNEAIKSLFRPTTAAEETAKLSGETQLSIQVSATINLNAEALQQVREELENLTSRRNVVMHHLTEKFNISAIAGCQAAVQYLSETADVVDKADSQLTEMLKGSLQLRRILAQFLQSPEMSAFLDNPQNSSGSIHVTT